MARSIGEAVNAVEFDTVFSIENGRVIEHGGARAPSVYHCETDDVWIDGSGWTALTGMTRQYGYRGAVMHPSEFIGDGLAEYLSELGGQFAITEVLDPEDMDELIGWVIVHRPGA